MADMPSIEEEVEELKLSYTARGDTKMIQLFGKQCDGSLVKHATII